MRKYEDTRILHENRMPQRSYYIPEDSCTLLNGIWQFSYYKCDTDAQPSVSCPMDVPSCWQYRGIEPPYYTNEIYPYPVDPPFVPMQNPMGVYTREFCIRSLDTNYYIVFEGVSSCVELFINGQYAGFSQGSHL